MIAVVANRGKVAFLYATNYLSKSFI